MNWRLTYRLMAPDCSDQDPCFQDTNAFMDCEMVIDGIERVLMRWCDALLRRIKPMSLVGKFLC